MGEDQVKLDARLWAIELMLANAFKLIYRLSGTPPEAVLKAHAELRESLSRDSVPGLHAAESDMWVAEIQAAVEDILSKIEAVTDIPSAITN
jgi:hypothetical protein